MVYPCSFKKNKIHMEYGGLADPNKLVLLACLKGSLFDNNIYNFFSSRPPISDELSCGVLTG